MPKRENPYLLIVNPETGEGHAVTPEGYVKADHEAQGYRVDMWQDGRKYDGPLPKITNPQRERLGLVEPTPEAKTVAGVEARAADREARRVTPRAPTPEPEPAPEK